MTALTVHVEPMVVVAAGGRHRRLHAVCTHELGGLPWSTAPPTPARAAAVSTTPSPGSPTGTTTATTSSSTRLSQIQVQRPTGFVLEHAQPQVPLAELVVARVRHHESPRRGGRQQHGEQVVAMAVSTRPRRQGAHFID